MPHRKTVNNSQKSSERNVRTFERDLPLLAAMGANALRVYHFDWGGGQSHARFFNACAAHNITVMGGFELHAHPASAHSLNTTAGLAAARAALAAPPPAGIARVVAIADFSAAARAAAAELPPPPQRARQKTAGPLV